MKALVHAWYIYFQDQLGDIDPQTVYSDALAAIKAEDPDAYIEEVRQYPYQIAFYVNHPTITEARAHSLGYQSAQILWAIVGVAILIAVHFLLQDLIGAFEARMAYEREHKIYTCPGTPGLDPAVQCAQHLDAEGNVMTFNGYTEFMAHLATAHTASAEYLQNINQKPWWEAMGLKDIFVIFIILIGVGIVVPPIISAVFKRKHIKPLGTFY